MLSIVWLSFDSSKEKARFFPFFLYNLGEESKNKEEKKKNKLEEKESRYGTPLKINSFWFVLLIIVIWFMILN